MLDGRGLDDHRAAVALWAKRDPAVASNDDEGPLRRQDGASDDAQAVTEGAACRKSQEFGGDQWASNAEQLRDLLRRAVETGAVVRDVEPVAVDLSGLGPRAGVKTIVGDFFEYEPPQSRGGDTCLLLQALDRAEQSPVLALEFEILGGG